jgi:protein arginine kinase
MTQKKWYQHCGNDGDVVISTRIRLARNLNHLPFPAFMSTEQKQEIVSRLFEVLPEGEGQAFTHIDMSTMTETQALSMVERHLISPEFARCGEGEALLLSEDESVSIMINEEDHLRIQVMRTGLDLDGAYQEADCWDNYLDTRLQFAFDDRLGYLTQCPSNLGAGMRASLMLHLPALQERGIVQQLASTVSKLGLTIRGMYGEGSKSKGAIYQLSNQVTLGITETEAIDNLKGIAAQIIKEERQWRETLGKTPAVQDRIFRSLGILQNARLLSGKEFMALMSNVRMGVSLKLIDHTDLDHIGMLLVDAQPATLMLNSDRQLEPEERDARRAQLVRERLNKEE